MPIKIAVKAIISGVFTSPRAAAAGMINIAPINNAPTTFMAIATVIASASIKNVCSDLAFIPLAKARSALIVVAKRTR
jgi:hypothetical protein